MLAEKKKNRREMITTQLWISLIFTRWQASAGNSRMVNLAPDWLSKTQTSRPSNKTAFGTVLKYRF